MQVTDEYIKEVSDNLDISKFHNINGFDLNDYSWMDHIKKDKGVIFIASGVFYYFKKV